MKDLTENVSILKKAANLNQFTYWITATTLAQKSFKSLKVFLEKNIHLLIKEGVLKDFLKFTYEHLRLS